MLLVLFGCLRLCNSHLYEYGFEHPKLARACFCAYEVFEVKDTDPKPLPITLRWKQSVPVEERKAEFVGPAFPRYNLLVPEDE